MLALSVGATSTAAAQDVKNIDDYSCKDIMRAGGDERDLAITFLHGYLLGKSGTVSFRPDDLAQATDRFVEHCLDNPGDTAVKALAASKK
jgi:hypothetical protein